MNVSVILSGGVGVRFGNELPKQYQNLLGKEVIAYVVEALKQSVKTDEILIVAGKEDIPRLQSAYGVSCTVAGSSHNASVKNGLEYIQAHYPSCRNVLWVDAARPFLDAKTVDQYFTWLNEYDGVITTRRITDSLGREGVAFTNREEYYLIQKPEAFKFSMLYSRFSASSETTAIVHQFPHDAAVKKCFGSNQNMKITYPEDLPLAEYLMGFNMKQGTN